MTTLSKVTQTTRKVLAIGAMLFVGFLLIYFGVKIGLSVKESLYPTPPPPPTVTYGKLPQIPFPTQQHPIAFTYSLNTVSGSYPTFSDRAKIYKIATLDPNLLSMQKAQENIKGLRFESKPSAISDVVYQWTNSETPIKTLQMNIQTNNFIITSPYLNDPTVLGAENVPDQQTSITSTTSFLTSMENFPDDIDTNKTKVSLFAISNNQLIPATSLSNTQIVRVDYFQKDVDKLPLVYATPSLSPMSFLLGSSNALTPQIVEAHFFHQSISDDFATYPIKTAKEAYEDLKNGNAYIASSPSFPTEITIRTISLAYFMSNESMQYLMPVIVFQGDNNFVAYVSAVSENWITNEEGK